MIRSLRPIVSCVYSALAILSSAAAIAADSDEVDTPLPPIYVEAQQGDSSNASTQVLKRQDLDKAGAEDLKTLLRYEPGVEVESQSGLTNGNFNIRGIAEDRVWVMVDGLNLPDAFKDSFWYGGGGARGKNGMTFGQNLVEPDTINTVSVVKGPFEAQYSNEAIGGAVNMRTYDPEDLIAEGNNYGALFKSGYNSGNQGWAATVGGAARNDLASGLIMYTHRDYAEVQTAGTQANEQDNRSNNVLFKGKLDLGEHQLSATGEYFKRDGHSKDLLSLNSFDDTNSERVRGSLAYQYLPDNTTALQAIKAGYDYQDLQSDMLQTEASRSALNRHLQGYNQTQHRAYAQGLWQFDAGIEHNVLAGIDYRRVETSTDRHSVNYDLSSGAQIGAADDLLYYPANTKNVWSAFIQDRMVFDNGVSLTPALRYSHEKATPNRADFARLKNQANVDFDDMIAGASYSKLLPSLKLNVPLNDSHQLFAAYARGFKAPQYDAQGAASHSVLNGMIQYYNVPNFDLKPEESDNFEFGWQHDSANTHAKITGFYNRYKNFIAESQTVRTLYPTGRPMPMVMELSSVNLDKVVTYGLEARGQYDFAPYWNVNGSLFWMRGINKEDDSHMNSELPMKLRLGVAYANETWGANADWTLSRAKTEYATADKATPKTPGYGLLDVGAFWKLNKNAKLTLNAYNVLDKKYWLPADMLWLNTTGQLDKQDSYTQMGRAISAGINITF
ncbi:TonB-dependent hemoglobin/transferrin/lactoferrin family receptor [Vitreoscilla massiliensis]|uniref:TonB-dependent hemoglobin/transferrin/lactoferrin family receptor n=1 Tax=Vitreoscilla massiliensis TaxID=1689272 RepID=A0ABY4E1L7_9NEIS|nr:TonB-dependent hemoglobin/transferrin/lactoferrin family receptor [Vitreoscilla massiliensis]UOO88218.1 TonB-dependent hemoglobin/transferrin/lactoferrin family receptor [Vitreoscilla massiliensis]